MSDEQTLQIQQFFDRINQQYTHTLKSELQDLRRQLVETSVRTWREVRKTLPLNTVSDTYFQDTKPNYIIVTNYSNEDVYVGSSPNLSTALYDFLVPAHSRIQWVWGRGLDRLYVLDPTGTATVVIQSYEGNFDPGAVAQTKMIADASTVGLVGNVKLDPSGNSVKFDSAQPVTINGSLPNQVQEVTALSALAIIDTANHDSNIVDLTTLGGKKNIYVYNSLNQAATLTLISYGSVTTAGAAIAAQTVNLSAGSSKLITFNDIKELNEPLNRIKIRIACTVAPTSGSVSASVEGVGV